MTITLENLNSAGPPEALAMLDGLYEHSNWIVEQALTRRPFSSMAHLKGVLVDAVALAGREAQTALVRAHPELAGKAMLSRTLTAESTNEQTRSGLTNCSPKEFARIQQLNAAYNAKFGWPFILAVRGSRGLGLKRAEIIETFARRLGSDAETELTECLRNIHRIAELRLNERFGFEPALGNQVFDLAARLARHGDPDDDVRRLRSLMKECGFDETFVDAAGSVVGVYWSAADVAGRVKQQESPVHPRLLTGSQFFADSGCVGCDDRLGVFVSLVCVRELQRSGRRLPLRLEVAGFVRTAARPGLQSTLRDPVAYLGFLAVQLEPASILAELGIPLGVGCSSTSAIWQQRCQRAVESLGVKVHCLADESGQNTTQLREAIPYGTLLVRRSGDGTGHELHKSITTDDADLCVRAVQQLFDLLATGQSRSTTE